MATTFKVKAGSIEFERTAWGVEVWGWSNGDFGQLDDMDAAQCAELAAWLAGGDDASQAKAAEASSAENICAVVIVEFLAALAGGWPFGWQWDSGWGDYRGPGDDCADNQREAWALEYQARPRIEP